MLTLGLHPIATGALIILFVFVCVLLILTVLIQRPSGGGLSGAFGSGAGSGQTAFGAKTGDALTIATIIMFVLFLAFAVGLNYAARPPTAAVPAMVPTSTTEGGTPESQPESVPPAQPTENPPAPASTAPAQTPPAPVEPGTPATQPPLR